MKKLLALLTFLLFLLLSWFAWNWYKSNVVCCSDAPVAVTSPLHYECGTVAPITGEGWAEKKEAIIASVEPGQKLLIVGPYFSGEDKSKGLERAENVKALFLDKMKAEDIDTEAWLAGDCQEGLTDALHMTLFKPVIRNEHVVEYHDRAYVYFKYDSTTEIDTKHVVEYLNGLIDEYKKNGGTILLIGHTDADGTEDYNYELGLRRANRVKDYLVKRGVPEDKIIVESKGKTEPLDTNGTPEGKQRNRRVEIRIK